MFHLYSVLRQISISLNNIYEQCSFLNEALSRGYKYRTRRELMEENLEVHARAEATAREKHIAFQVEVEKLKEQIAHEAAEREREREENRRKMQEELEEAKIKLREEMKQDLLNMLAQHKEANMNKVIFQNIFLILLPLNKLMIMMMNSLLPQYLLFRVPRKTLTV
jgi:hypothetical protein